MSRAHLSVTVVAPEGVLYAGAVLAISGTNDTGPFSVLPGHINFISIVRGSLVLHESSRRAKKIAINYGIVFCRRDQVEVYVGTTAASLPPPVSPPAAVPASPPAA